MNNFWHNLKKPILALAPMAGITDSAFRQICRKHGADVVYSEMASVSALFFKPAKTLELVKFEKTERPYVIQLFGKDPEHFAKATRILDSLPLEKGDARRAKGFEKFCENIKSFESPLIPLFQRGKLLRPDGIDINFGCPAKKVFGHGSGCALMPQKKLAREIISAVCENTKLPVSLKIRAGVGEVDAVEFIENVKDLPFAAVMIHCRTFEQKFSGPADFSVTEKIKKIIPDRIVLGNGGITEAQQAKEILEKYPLLDGLGIARGTLGQPWIFEEIKKLLQECRERTCAFRKNGTDISVPYNKNYDSSKIKKIALEHARLLYETKGQKGFLEIRKHLAWYVKGLTNASELRQKLVRVESLEEIKKILDSAIF